ncbi:hypothetical protein FB45DRAFT_1126696 [Roridomyces roridus]|uniref:C2H2-type domain-containing protein n=1 Tax=Roridomyces roridus TaxID=1738132 RepID=A0AAD7C992_9AGAR|nr:hypothetical protein FB45DRAFT_1126696 [Roridomyces roridus]
MSFALPLSSLRNIQISCKISLPDGSFSFEMTPIDSEPRYSDNVSVLDAMTLHVISSPGQDGVTLTFFATGGGKYADDPVGLMNSLSVPALEQTPDSVPPNSEQLPLHFPAIGLDESTVPSDNDLEFQESNQIRLLEFLDLTMALPVRPAADPPQAPLLVCPSQFHIPAADGNATEWIPYPHFDATHSSPPPSSSWPTPGSATPVPANTDPKSKFQCTLGCDLKFSRRHDRLRHEVAQHGRECEWECPGTLEKHRCVGRRSGSDGGNDFNPARRLCPVKTDQNRPARGNVITVVSDASRNIYSIKMYFYRFTSHAEHLPATASFLHHHFGNTFPLPPLGNSAHGKCRRHGLIGLMSVDDRIPVPAAHYQADYQAITKTEFAAMVRQKIDPWMPGGYIRERKSS